MHKQKSVFLPVCPLAPLVRTEVVSSAQMSQRMKKGCFEPITEKLFFRAEENKALPFSH